MPLNIGHAEDAYLEGSTMFEEFIMKFELEFSKPIKDQILQAQLQMLPEPVRKQLQELNPEAYNMVIESIGGG